jgi:hypothetical protein
MVRALFPDSFIQRGKTHYAWIGQYFAFFATLLQSAVCLALPPAVAPHRTFRQWRKRLKGKTKPVSAPAKNVSFLATAV